MAKVGRMIGIDLGTTNSVVAIMDVGGPRVLHNMEHEELTQSIVGIFNDNILIGRPALNRWPQAPENTIVAIKRLMGRAISDEEVEKVRANSLYKIVQPSDGTKDSVSVILGNKEWSPVDISAEILKKLKSDAEKVLGEAVTHAVITVPAYFNEKQRYATKQAGLKAGLIVMKLLEEPSAAALAYSVGSKSKDAKLFLVYDLGGGTFDISVIMMTAGAFAPLALQGNMWLGGQDFDQVIVDYVLEQIRKKHGIDVAGLEPKVRNRFLVTLHLAARSAKETLSSSRSAPIVISSLLRDASGDILDIDEEISREEFERRIKKLVDGSIDMVRSAVEKANFTLDDIDHVILAGNSTAVPLVQESVEALVGKEKVIRKIHPKYSVAMGAAIAAALGGIICEKCGCGDNSLDADDCKDCGAPLSRVEKGNLDQGTIVISTKLTQIAAFNYGVQSSGDKFTVFVNANDQFETRPEARKFETFHTTFASQRIISIPVFGGDDLERASKNVKQGEAFAVLPAGLPADTPVRIKLWLGKDGEFQLEVSLANGTELKPWILRGGQDQKVKDLYLESIEVYLKRIDQLSPAQETEAEKHSEKVLEHMGRGELAAAQEAALAFKAWLGSLAQTGEGEADETAMACQFALYLATEFGWLIGPQAYSLTKCAGEVQDAARRGDNALQAQKLSELQFIINSFMTADDGSGAQQPSLLGVLLSLTGAINSMILPHDAVGAKRLLTELAAIQERLKAQSPGAVESLFAFMRKVEGSIPAASGNAIVCEACGAQNDFGTHLCVNCNADLWIARRH